MLPMLVEHKVDLFGSVPPFSLDPSLRAVARPLFTQKEALGVTQMAVWVARASFIKEHRAALVDYLEDALRLERWYLDPANHREAVEIAARVSKRPAEKFDSWLFTDRDYYRDRNGLPNLDALQANIRVQKDLGFLKSDLKIKEYTALDLVQEAAKRIAGRDSQGSAN
jgi:NitT/TauT family transport system substrate-binding protein